VDAETGEVQRGLPWSKLEPRKHTIILAEGIETSLTLAVAMPERRIACVISVAGFAEVLLPPAFWHVTIAADRDPENKATANALDRAAQAIAASGRHGTIQYPPAPFDDWNSLLQHLTKNKVA
jgi:phage/plasmid primase-like uncharacterized protein